jgi:thiol:disulfide interchange protein DsbC
MRRGIAPASVTCANPIDRVVALGAALRVQGTPTLFAGDGRRLVGAQPAAESEAWLAASGPSHAGAPR